MDFEYLVANKQHRISITKEKEAYSIQSGDESFLLQPVHHGAHYCSLKKNDELHKIYFAQEGNVLYISVGGQQFRIEGQYKKEQKSIAREHVLLGNESEVCAPMPGRILKILVNEGDPVAIKQNLVIVEAMKMENNIHSSIAGVVKKINFKENDIVDTGQPIIEIEPKSI